MNKWIYLLSMRQALTITKNNYIANMHLHFCLSILLLLLWGAIFMGFASLHRSNHELSERAKKTRMVVFVQRKGGIVSLVLCFWCCVVGVVMLVLWCWCCKVEIYISSPQTEVRYWQTRGRNITSNWKLLIGGRLYNFLFKLSFNFFHLLL